MRPNQNHDAEPSTTQTPAKAAASPWFRQPRNLIVLALALVAVIVGVFVVVNRDSGRGSATAKVGSGPNKTLADYFSANDVTQTPVRPGDPGIPTITIPVPPGWSDAGPDTPSGAYAEIIYDAATNPDDAPFVEVLLSRLDGSVDPRQVLEYAPGELRNLPDYRPVSEPMHTKLTGFDAVQLAGLYTKDGQERIIAQKTVVVPTSMGMFVVQMNADGPKSDAPVVQQVTAHIDERSTITA